mgnify:CR=1 FL=1
MEEECRLRAFQSTHTNSHIRFQEVTRKPVKWWQTVSQSGQSGMRIGGRGDMKQWERNQFLLRFREARTRDSCILWGSHLIHSITEVCKIWEHFPFLSLSLFTLNSQFNVKESGIGVEIIKSADKSQFQLNRGVGSYETMKNLAVPSPKYTAAWSSPLGCDKEIKFQSSVH